MLEKSGEIEDLKIQVKYLLIPSQKFDTLTENERPVYYRADFVYRKAGTTVIEDVKGCKTKDYILKRKLMKSLYCSDDSTIFIET